MGPDTSEHRRKTFDMAREIICGAHFGDSWENMHDKEFMVKTFNEHVEYVKRTVPQDRLLVVGLGDGWEPFCKFLGKEIPNVPYPNFNSTKEFKKLKFGDPNGKFETKIEAK